MASRSSLTRALLLPVHAAQLLSGTKSFRHNLLLASPRINRGGGLHARRVELAARLAKRRQRAIRHLLGEDLATSIDRDGFAMVENALPAQVFDRLRQEVEETRLPAREMKQGGTVTRFITLPPEILRGLPALRDFVTGPLFQGCLRYAASFDHEPLVNLHTVMTDPEAGAPDPQTHFHSDTFHATAKGWFFLRDVAVEDGPFTYVPGSHRVTPGRLAWERAQSVSAADHPNPHHAQGSFRAGLGEIREMGFGDPVRFAVPANTLVVADTHGFHARGRSLRKSTRLAIYGSLRSNPFMPVAGLDPFRLPGLRGRRAQVLDMMRDMGARMAGRTLAQPPVGLVRPGDPPVR
ncbi:MAG: phytanoyl-CoA dioxygenase family protein [Pseudomonadota bacterium]